ncbi:MAG: glycosyltransferase family 4 protein [Oscillospiraceae bacterium]
MKVLWLINSPLPVACKAFDLPMQYSGGWLIGQLDDLQNAGLEMYICAVTYLVKEKMEKIINGVTHILLPNDADFKTEFENIQTKIMPDVTHIFGTEFPHSFEMMKVSNTEKCVVSVQGLIGECAKSYSDGLPSKYSEIRLPVRLMSRVFYADSIEMAKEDFARRGRIEAQTLKRAKHIIGRTAWDKKCTAEVNPDATYHKVNENLRGEFYTNEMWSGDTCQRHSIFVSQSYYPIKGFHQLLKALPNLVKKYPDLHLFVGGIKPYTLHNKFLDVFVNYFFEYQGYINKLIDKNHLRKYITYTGGLNAKEMKEMYLKTNVFASVATVENSPNSVAEAMMLGVPVVASNVGGTSSLLTDGEDGILYNFYDINALETAISKFFDDDDFAEKMGKNASEHAKMTHDKTKNTQDLLRVYEEIGK